MKIPKTEDLAAFVAAKGLTVDEAARVFGVKAPNTIRAWKRGDWGFEGDKYPSAYQLLLFLYQQHPQAWRSVVKVLFPASVPEPTRKPKDPVGDAYRKISGK